MAIGTIHRFPLKPFQSFPQADFSVPKSNHGPTLEEPLLLDLPMLSTTSQIARTGQRASQARTPYHLTDVLAMFSAS
jgi:hypothetical protein